MPPTPAIVLLRSTRARLLAGAIVMLLALPGASPAQTRPATPPGLADLSRTFETLAARVSPSVVQVLTSGYGPGNLAAPLTRQRGGGSGVVLDADGHIITNAHVVAGARRIQVVLARPREIGQTPASLLKPEGQTIDARLVGMDLETDLAVLKVDTTGIAALAVGDSDEVRQGQLVFAFGSPFGLENSVTMGVVSSVARQLRVDDPMVYIQTDASISAGSSGGPLVDAQGRLVGINTLILNDMGGSAGVGFAAPSNIVRAVFDQIRQKGRVIRGVIGVHAQSVTPTLAGGLGLSRNWGVVVGDVYPGGSAEAAGVRVGDIIVSVDGKIIENARQFDVNIYRRQVGDTVSLELLRGQEPVRTTVAVTERSDDPMQFFDRLSPERNMVPKLGILGIDVDARIAERLKWLRQSTGVLVVSRAGDSVSTEGGLLPGDVIVALNGAPIAGLSALRVALDKMQPRAACVLHVQRGPLLAYVPLELE